MNFLKSIDGNKTYILAIITGAFTMIHFMVTSDYSLASFIQLSQDSAVIAMIAALRHAVAKTTVPNNQGVLPQGVQQ